MTSGVPALKIMYWNANSIKNKIVELYNYMAMNQIDVMCLSETFLKPNDHIISHPDYRWYRLDRTRNSRGGVAILIRRQIRHELLPHLNMRLLETIGIKIFLANNSTLEIFSTYLPGASASQSIQQYYINDLRRITRSNRNVSYFVCGDLNSRHRSFNCRSSNLAGRLLYDEYMRSDFIVAFPDSPTYIPEDSRRTSSTIDIMITNSLLQFSSLRCVYLGSDHNAVRTDVQISAPSILNNNRLVRAFDLANWRAYQRHITSKLDSVTMNLVDVTNTTQIDDMVSNLTNSISEAQNVAVPLVPPGRYEVQLTPFLQFLITLRRTYRREWQRTRDPMIKTEVNALTSQIRQGIQDLRNEKWSHRLQELPVDDNKKSLWKIARYLKNKNRGVPALEENDTLLLTSEEKAESLASKFSEFHDNPLGPNNPSFTNRVQSTVSAFMSNPSDESPEYPTIEETSLYIKQLKRSKAPGMDRIHNTLVKNLPQCAILYLNFIICCCFKLGYFPTQWKIASVVPIHKPGKDPSKSSSYRPISLLSTLSKIMERAILFRISCHTEEHDIIPDAQHGFRQFRSTTHQLLRVTQHLRHNLSLKRTTGVILFDIEKAFDRIWHCGLIYKMINLRYPRYIIRLISSFLSQRKFHVTVGGKTSTSRNIPYGVPQGAVLSPCLYNIYTSDAPTFNDCMLAFYADDTAIISGLSRWQNTHIALTRAAHEFCSYYDRWKINLNTGKTQALLVTRRRIRELPHGPFMLNDEEIMWETQAKYLGVIIDRTITMKPHIEYVIEKTQKAIKILYPLIHRRSRLSIDNKKLIFKTALRPIYTYACPLYDAIAKSHLQKLQILQNRILKMIFNLPWYTRTTSLHSDNDIELVQDFTNRLKENFTARLQFS